MRRCGRLFLSFTDGADWRCSDCTDQAPYAMNTPETILRLPKSNPSHDLCFFLRSTGPTAPHRRPSMLSAAEPEKTSSSRDKFRFRKLRQDAQVKAAKIREAVGLPPELVPSSVEQKASSSGTTTMRGGR